jgi:hypothetical protein
MARAVKGKLRACISNSAGQGDSGVDLVEFVRMKGKCRLWC